MAEKKEVLVLKKHKHVNVEKTQEDVEKLKDFLISKFKSPNQAYAYLEDMILRGKRTEEDGVITIKYPIFPGFSTLGSIKNFCFQLIPIKDEGNTGEA